MTSVRASIDHQLIVDESNGNNDVPVDNGNATNRRQRRGIGRTPTLFLEPRFPQHCDNLNEWPRADKKTRRSFTSNEPDYIMEVRYNHDDGELMYACGYKNSQKFQWLSSEEIRSKNPQIIIDFYYRQKDYYTNEI